MPIYAYKCSVCGHTKDVLQKIADDPLTVCPACGASAFSKQVTAAGFQLKGSGWYVTDFRDGGNKSSGASDSATSATPAAASTTPAEKSSTSDTSSVPSTGVSSTATSPTPSAGTSSGSSTAATVS